MTGRITVTRERNGRFAKLRAIFRPQVVPPLRDTLMQGVVVPPPTPLDPPATGIGRNMASNPPPMPRPRRAEMKPWVGVFDLVAALLVIAFATALVVIWGFGR